MRSRLVLLAAIAVSLLLVTGYRAAGGGSYAPERPASPCLPRQWAPVSSLDSAENNLALSTLDGAACDLHVSAADLALAFASPHTLEQFQSARGISDLELAAAAKSGIVRAFADGERSGEINSTLAGILQAGAQAVPEKWLADQARRLLEAVR
jgi:hypothetical protein